MRTKANAEGYAAVQEYVLERIEVWIPRMGLSHFEIDVKFLDCFDPEEDQDGDFHTTMICESKWAYLIANIKVFLPSAIRWSCVELDKTIVHELCHILLSAEQSCIVKPSDNEKLEMSTEMASRVIYNAWEGCSCIR